MVRFVVISDTHEEHFEQVLPRIPDGDVLLHCGDFTNRGDLDAVRSFNEFLGQLPHKHKIVICGNHDYLDHYTKEQIQRDLLPNCTYLQDASTFVEGIEIYGSPWTPSCNMAWRVRGGPSEVAALWSRIPSSADIVMTHQPMHNVLDLAWVRRVHPETCGVCHKVHRSYEHWGCALLRRELTGRVRPTFHCTGHVHDGYGTQRVPFTQHPPPAAAAAAGGAAAGDTADASAGFLTCVNAALSWPRKFHAPQVFDFDPATAKSARAAAAAAVAAAGEVAVSDETIPDPPAAAPPFTPPMAAAAAGVVVAAGESKSEVLSQPPPASSTDFLASGRVSSAQEVENDLRAQQAAGRGPPPLSRLLMLASNATGNGRGKVLTRRSRGGGVCMRQCASKRVGGSGSGGGWQHSDAQLWRVTCEGYLKAATAGGGSGSGSGSSDSVLDVDRGSTRNGAKLCMWRPLGAANQKWLLSPCASPSGGPGGSSSVVVRSAMAAGLRRTQCMALDVDEAAGGDSVALWTQHGGANQSWRLLLADEM